MKTIWHLAAKDLKLLLRDRMGAFFILLFPVLMGLFFGLAMGGISSGGSASRIKMALVDEDRSTLSAKLAELLVRSGNVEITPATMAEAMDQVRTGKRTGLLRVPAGFGERAGILWQQPPEIDIGMDPSRTAESGMVEGFIMQAMGEITGMEMTNTQRMLPMLDSQLEQARGELAGNPVQLALMETLFGSLRQMMGSVEQLNRQSEDGAGGENASGSQGPALGNGMQLASVNRIDVTREFDPKSIQAQARLMRSRWDISFPQAMLWGVMGCTAGFAISLVRERTLGTLPRLQMAPVGKLALLLGKSLACFLAVLLVFAVMTLLGVCLGMKPANYPMLVASAFCIAWAFVGIMMSVSVLGKSEQGVSGAGWAINMVMAMLGGAMIPAMFLPEFLQRVSVASPVRWSILAVEGSIWRNFSWSEFLLPAAILIAIGAGGLSLGLAIWTRRPNC